MILVVAFLSMFFLDIVWGHYTLALTARRAPAAATHAALIVVLNSAAVLSYIHDPMAIASAALGAFCGTYVVTFRTMQWLENLAHPVFDCVDCYGSLSSACACQCAAYDAGAPGMPRTRGQNVARILLTILRKCACVSRGICARLSPWTTSRR